MTGAERIAAERRRQIMEEGWGGDHDAQHMNGELAYAGAVYALRPLAELYGGGIERLLLALAWPFERSWWKPTPDDRIRELEKAGALIAAEIDRLSRTPTPGAEKESR